MQSTKGSPLPEWDLLLSAAQKNRADVIVDMVKVGGVDPSHSNAVGQSALHIACLWGNVESIEALIELGANVNAQNNLTGATPLHMVANSHKVQSLEVRLRVVDLLLLAGANINLADHYGNLPVNSIHSFPNGDTEVDSEDILSQLLEKLLPQKPPIYQAILEKDVVMVRNILESRDTLSNVEFGFKTPVIYSVDELVRLVEELDSGGEATVEHYVNEMKKMEEILDILVSHGGNPNLVPSKANDDDKKIPLHEVACALRLLYKRKIPECIEIIRKIISFMIEKGGAEVPLETTRLLYQAARWGELPFIQFLIEDLNVDSNTPGPQSMTPLHFAARSGRTDVVRYLLSQPGINVEAKDTQGKTALDAAMVNNRDEAVEILERFLDN